MKRERLKKEKTTVYAGSRSLPKKPTVTAKDIAKRRIPNITRKVASPLQRTDFEGLNFDDIIELAHQYRKPSYKRYMKTYLNIIHQLTILGATDALIAEALGMTTASFDSWKKKYPEIHAVMRLGKSEADAKVANALYHSALGFTVDEEVIVPNKVKTFNGFGKVVAEHLEIITTTKKKYYPPNVKAAIKWLAVRQPEVWSEKRREMNGNIVQIQNVNFNDFSKEELQALTKMGFSSNNLELPVAKDEGYTDYTFIDDGEE